MPTAGAATAAATATASTTRGGSTRCMFQQRRSHGETGGLGRQGCQKEGLQGETTV